MLPLPEARSSYLIFIGNNSTDSPASFTAHILLILVLLCLYLPLKVSQHLGFFFLTWLFLTYCLLSYGSSPYCIWLNLSQNKSLL